MEQVNTLFYDASLRGSLCSARDPRNKVMAELLLASWSPDIEVECAQSRKQKQALRVHPANVSAHLRGDKDKTWGKTSINHRWSVCCSKATYLRAGDSERTEMSLGSQ